MYLNFSKVLCVFFFISECSIAKKGRKENCWQKFWIWKVDLCVSRTTKLSTLESTVSAVQRSSSLVWSKKKCMLFHIKKYVISKDKNFFVYDQKFPWNGVTNTTKFFSFYEEKVCFLFDQTIYISTSKSTYSSNSDSGLRCCSKGQQHYIHRTSVYYTAVLLY